MESVQENKEFSQRIQRAAKELHSAIDRSAAAITVPEQLDQPCDEYTVAAKRFAALILAERVRQSFVGKINPETGFPTETLQEKIEHTSTIRKWLAPWNLAFECLRPDGKRIPYQLYAMTSGHSHGSFALAEYGTGLSPNRTKMSGWKRFVSTAIERPVLIDVTDFTRHHSR